MSAPPKPNTGREACNVDLQQFFDAMKPFIFADEREIAPHRLTINDSAGSVQDAYNKYVKEHYNQDHELDHDILDVTGNVAEPFKLSIFTPNVPAPAGGRPCLYFIHGGGLVTNNRFSGINSIFSCIYDLNAVCVSIEYSLAPETKAPIQVEQCYEGLKELWNQHNGSGKINFDKLAIIGRSAGATLLVGLNLKMIKHPDIKIRCNVMSFPMQDNQCATNSHIEFCDAPHLPRKTVKFFWKQWLGEGVVGSKLTVPALATKEDLKDFPPTFLQSGGADVLSDEAKQFQEKLLSAEVHAPIRSYPGYHCFDSTETEIAGKVKEERLQFLVEQMA